MGVGFARFVPPVVGFRGVSCDEVGSDSQVQRAERTASLRRRRIQPLEIRQGVVRDLERERGGGDLFALSLFRHTDPHTCKEPWTSRPTASLNHFSIAAAAACHG